MTNVDTADLSAKQHCPHRVHYAAENSAEHCQKRTQKNLACFAG